MSTHAMGLAAYSNDFVVEVQPPRLATGGIAVVTAEIEPKKAGAEAGTYTARWVVEGPVLLSEEEMRIALLGATTVTPRTGDHVVLSHGTTTTIRATLDTSPLVVGSWRVGLVLTLDVQTADEADPEAVSEVSISGVSDPFEVVQRPFAAGDDVSVTLRRTSSPPTPDQALWVQIRNATNALGFDNYSRFIEAVMCDHPDDAFSRFERRGLGHKFRKVKRRTALPFPNVDRYRLLKAATEVFMMTHCGVDLDDFSGVDLNEESRRLNRSVEQADLRAQMQDYLERVPGGEGELLDVLPYLGLIRLQLRDVAVVHDDADDAAQVCYGILAEKLTHPCFLELIHSYWLDEGRLVQTLNAVMWRFQNRTSAGRGHDPLASLDVDPLRPLNNLLWGVVQDQQHRLTTVRRAYEYDHAYGLMLGTRPGPPVRGADSRSRFIEAFHNLLAMCAEFYVNDDHTTVIADAFPVLNALKETHLLLTEGAHNQYGDLPWTARHEMLMYQWILSRPEVREFLPSRRMVVYPEPWIAPVDTMSKLQGWSDIPVLHFRDLAVCEEQLLLSIRYGNWNDVNDADQAGNWARYFRQEVRQTMHAYRAVTGFDVSEQAGRRMPVYGVRRRSRVGMYRG
jgi:hypothetical protein